MLTKDKIPFGILFIGDPHCWSKKPGRRRDTSFQKTVLGKIQQAVEICHEKNLFPILLGDLFHADDDNDVAMMVSLIRLMKSFPYRPIMVDGNHDKENLILGDHNPLKILSEGGQLDVISTLSKWGVLTLEDPQTNEKHSVAIGGSPYGTKIPRSYREAYGEERSEDIGTALWLTHEDLNFDGSYPDAIPIYPMDDVEMVVNGHIHGTKKPVKAGDTVFHNPGNITRLSIDTVDHIPSVWEWSPFDLLKVTSASGSEVDGLKQHVLKVENAQDVFNFEGRHTKDTSAIILDPTENESAFVKMASLEGQQERTDDGIYIEQTVHTILEGRNSSEGARRIILGLLQNAVKKNQETL